MVHRLSGLSGVGPTGIVGDANLIRGPLIKVPYSLNFPHVRVMRIYSLLEMLQLVRHWI